jgi:NAD(P)-dependent dehydrogenase (short-subunit alcohol dehydrogenase family)
MFVIAQSYPTDLQDASAVKATLAAVHQDLGPISVVFWNPYSTPAPLLTATPEQVQSAYNVTVTGKPSVNSNRCSSCLLASLHEAWQVLVFFPALFGQIVNNTS